MIRKFLLFGSLVIVLNLVFSSCTLFKKNISKEVIVALPDTLFTASIGSTAMYTKYTNTLSSQQIVSSFLKGFVNESKNTANVKFQFGTEGADYLLKIKSLRISETSKTEKINDTKSAYNGQEVLLNTVEAYADLDITELNHPETKLNSCSNSKQRSESETNNRDLGDLVTGANKDHTKYHTKLLSDNIAISLAEDVGRRVWVPITRRISKQVN